MLPLLSTDAMHGLCCFIEPAWGTYQLYSVKLPTWLLRLYIYVYTYISASVMLATCRRERRFETEGRELLAIPSFPSADDRLLFRIEARRTYRGWTFCTPYFFSECRTHEPYRTPSGCSRCLLSLLRTGRSSCDVGIVLPSLLTNFDADCTCMQSTWRFLSAAGVTVIQYCTVPIRSKYGYLYMYIKSSLNWL